MGMAYPPGDISSLEGSALSTLAVDGLIPADSAAAATPGKESTVVPIPIMRGLIPERVPTTLTRTMAVLPGLEVFVIIISA